MPKDELRSSVLQQLAPFCLPIWITECSFVKFANKFSESLLGTDSVNFSLICLLFGAKGIAKINRTLVKTWHFCEGIHSTDYSLILPGRTNLAGKLRSLETWLVYEEVTNITWNDILFIRNEEHFFVPGVGGIVRNGISPPANIKCSLCYFGHCIKLFSEV